jgi:hypothetical protein
MELSVVTWPDCLENSYTSSATRGLIKQCQSLDDIQCPRHPSWSLAVFQHYKSTTPSHEAANRAYIAHPLSRS